MAAVADDRRSFAEIVDAVGAELRSELVREAQHWLAEWERHRRDEDRGRLLQTLELLALHVRTPG
jgi:hypothetical protein